MRIAVPAKDNMVEQHFGMCQGYLVFTAENAIIKEEVDFIPASSVCGCKSNVAAILQKKNVTVMLAGNMGNGAMNVLLHHGITVYRGLHGDARQCAADYIGGKVIDSGISCNVQHE